jgi:hypothetical protein
MEQSRLLCPIVEGQQCPPELLAQLRQIDSTAELIHFGGGDWRLGAVNPSDVRTRDGELMLKTMQDEKDHRAREPDPKNVLLAKLVLQGFAQIEQYKATMGISNTVVDSEGTPCTVLEDFRQRDAAWRKDQGQSVFERRLAVTNGDVARAEHDAQMKEFIRTDGRSHYRREIRNRVQFGFGGMTGGTKSGLILP